MPYSTRPASTRELTTPSFTLEPHHKMGLCPAATGIRTLDVADELCPSGVCSTQQGDTWMAGTFSPAASVRLIPIFIDFLRPEVP